MKTPKYLAKVVQKYLDITIDLLKKKRLNFKNVKLNEVPKKPGVYAIFDKNDIIYVGRTKNLQRRLIKEHRRGKVEQSQFRRALMNNYGFSDEEQLNRYIDKCSFSFVEMDKLIEMVRLEHFVTAILKPKLNVELKTDKNKSV